MRLPSACEILIIGGGPVGLALLLQLRASGHDAWLVESRTAPASNDARALALSAGSRQLLESLDAWPTEQAHPIHTVLVSQAGSLGRIKLCREELNLPALGYVVAMGDLAPRLWEKTVDHGLLPGWRAEAITSNAGYAQVNLLSTQAEAHTLTCRLVVMADGGKSLQELTGASAKIHDYEQVAILAHIKASHPQTNTAFERFAADGPIAVLPQKNGYAVVWTQSGSNIEKRLEEPAAVFCAALSQRLGGRLGQLTLEGTRHFYPLKLMVAPRRPMDRVITLGNAAQTLHPIAGQGLNLGLRDSQVLTRLLQNAHDAGDKQLLQRFQKTRRFDQAQAVSITHGLVEGFRLPGEFLKHIRSIGLAGLDLSRHSRRAFLSNLVFGWRQ